LFNETIKHFGTSFIIYILLNVDALRAVQTSGPRRPRTCLRAHFSFRAKTKKNK